MNIFTLKSTAPSIQDCFRTESGIYCDRRGHLVIPQNAQIEEGRTAIYALVRDQDRILLAWPWFGNGFADLPGGGIRADENQNKAMAREWEEETGLEHPFSANTAPSAIYQHRINFYAEDANILLKGYHQIFWRYEGTGTLPESALRTESWKSPEGYVSWEYIDKLPYQPINHVHWVAIQHFVPELERTELKPSSAKPRVFSF